MRDNSNKELMMLGKVALAVVALAVLYPFLSGLIIAFKDFKPFVGFFGSEGVGLNHFFRFFEYKFAGRLLTNSAIIGLVGLVFGAVYVYLSTLATASVKGGIAKGVVAFAFALPLALSAVSLADVLGEKFPDLLYEGGAALRVVAAIGGILPLAALFSLGGIFISENPGKGALKLTLLFVGVKLALLFVGNFDFEYMIQSPQTYEYTETLGTYVYSAGLCSASYSYGSAVSMVTLLLNIIPAIAGCFLISIAFKRTENEKALGGDSPASVASVIFAVIPVIIAGMVIVSSFGDYSMMAGGDALTGLFNSFAIAILTTILATALVFVISYAVKYSGVVGIIATLVLSMMTENVVAQFITTKWMWLVNTHFGAVLMNLKYVPLAALAFGSFLKLSSSDKASLATLPLAAGAAFAFAWGNLSASLICLTDSAKYPLQILVRQIRMQNVVDLYEFEALDTIITKIDVSVFVIIPIVVLAVCVIAGAMLAESQKQNSDF